MGIDEENSRFFGVEVKMFKPAPGERFTAIDGPGGVVILAAGPIVFLTNSKAVQINNKSKSDYDGNPVPGRVGIIDRALGTNNA